MRIPCMKEGVDCPERKPGCQGKCEKYIAYCAWRKEDLKKRREWLKAKHLVIYYDVENATKYKKRRK